MKIFKVDFMIGFIFYTLICIYGLLTYWTLWPYTPIIIKEPIHILNASHTVKAGDVLIYEMTMDKKMPLTIAITRQIVNTFVITYSEVKSNFDVERRVRKFKLPISEFADPGEYRLKWVGTIKVNPIRSMDVVAWSEPFNVILKGGE